MLFQAVLHPIIIVRYHHLYQAQFHRWIQVKHLAISPHSCFLQFLQLELLNILALYHNMYQVRDHLDLQVLLRALSHQKIQAQYQHLYQAKVHIEIEVKHPATSPQGSHLYFVEFIYLVIIAL